MFPILFQVGPFTLHSFGVMMALGFLAAFFIMNHFSRRGYTALTEQQLSHLIVWLMLGGVAGARLAYVLEHWQSEFAASPASIIRVDQGGLMFYGGVVGAILAIALFSRLVRRPVLEVLDLCAVVLPLGHALGRLGCFLNGCCYGMLCESLISVRYPAGSLAWRDQLAADPSMATARYALPVLPTQLIELAANLVLFGILAAVFKRKSRAGAATALYLMLYGVIRFSTEFLRGDSRLVIGSLSIGQWISTGTFGLGALLLIALLAKSRLGSRCAAAGGHG